MEITVAGFLVLFVFACLGIRKSSSFTVFYKKVFVFSVLVELVFDFGYVAKIGSFEFEFNYLVSGILFLLSIFILKANKPSREILVVSIVFLVEILIGDLITILFHRSFLSAPFAFQWDQIFGGSKEIPVVSFSLEQFLKMYIRFFIFVVNVVSISCVINKKLMVFLCEKSCKYFLFLFAFAIIEFLIENFYSSSFVRSLLIIFFGLSKSTVFAPRKILGVFVPLLLYREPSNMAFSMFVFGLFGLFEAKYVSKIKGLLVTGLSCVLLFCSGALSSLLYFLVLLIAVYFFVQKSHILKFSLLGVAVGGSTVSFLIFRDRILNIFRYFPLFSKGISSLPWTSENVRLYSIYNNFLLFLKNPLFGCGLGVLYCYSGLFSSLANIGLLGLCSWALMVSFSVRRLKIQKKSILIGFILLFLSSSLTGHMGFLLYFTRSYCSFLLLCFLSPFENPVTKKDTARQSHYRNRTGFQSEISFGGYK